MIYIDAEHLQDGLYNIKDGKIYKYKAKGGTVRAYKLENRPQGEWIRTGRTNVYGGIEVQCSNCGDKVMVQHLEDEWYCRHCGADMGMKGADDE